MSKLSQKVIAIAIVIAFVAVAVLYSAYNTHKSVIPDGTIGATAGNLNNNGLFCEYNGKVYFSNSYDNGALYCMNPDGSDAKKLNNLNSKYINVGGNSIIFYGDPIASGKGLGSVVQKPGMYIMGTNGQHLSALSKDTTGAMLLVDSNVFYQHYTKESGTTFAVMDLRKRKSTELLDYMINPVALYGRKIYFNGMYSDHHLYTFDVDTHEVTDIFGGDCWNPVFVGDYIYYMDVQNDYRLVRYNLTENVIEIVTKERVDFFNIYGDMIYAAVYQKAGARNPALKRYSLDGSASEVIKEGVFNDINVTSTYVYFKEFDDEYHTYCTPTFGPVNVTEFEAAKSALVLSR